MRDWNFEAQMLAPYLKSYIAPWLQAAKAGAGGGSGAGTGIGVHDLGGSLHSGILRNDQGPQFLLKDGSRNLAGNLAVDAGVTIDGVQIAAHAANPDAHHPRLHDLLSISDHFVSGLTTNQVLKAITGTSIGFGFVAHTELTNVQPNQHHNQVHNILGGDHTYTGGAALDLFGLTAPSTIGKITPSSNPGGAAAVLATTSLGSLTLGSTLFQLDNVGKTIGFGVAADGAASYDFMAAATADHTLRIKQLTSQTGRLWRVEDTSGNELIVLDSQGNLQSGQPGFFSGLTGWQITPQGNAEFNNAFIRGELHASIFVMDEFHAHAGTELIATAGKLENPWTVNLTSGNELVLDLRTTSASGSGLQLDLRTTSVSGSGSQLTTRNVTNYWDITDPPSGHAMLFTPGWTLRMKALGNVSPGIDLYDIWVKVLYVEDQTDFYRYYVQIMSGGTQGAVIPAGTADVSYGKKGDGRILLTSDLNYAPYIDVFLSGDTPWTGDIQPVTRFGRLDGVGLPGISGILQYGIVAGANLSDANSAYFVMSNVKQRMYRIDSEWNNGVNPTVTIGADGRFKIGYNVQNANQTVFDFNPALGTLNVGSPAYPFAVSLTGNMTIQAGSSGYGNLSDKPTALASINAGEGTKLNAGLDANGYLITKVLPGSAVGTPGGAGLFLGSDKMGYYNGSIWKTYMDASGNFTFASATSAKLAWDGTDLFGTDGSTVQWYARATTGKLYAGGGTVAMDNLGIHVANDATAKGITLYRVNTFSESYKSGRLWALSDLVPQVFISGGKQIGDGDATNAAGIVTLAGFDGTSTGAATLSVDGTHSRISMVGDVKLGTSGATDHVLGIRTTA